MKKTLKWRIAQKAELKWWERYLAQKPVDDYLSWKRAYWRDLLEPIRSEIGLDSAASILDAGCGPAGVFTIMDGLSAERINAFDPLLDSYAGKLDHFSKERYPHISFQNCGLEDFKGGSYDLVFCMNAINHVADISLAYDVLTRAVKPGGWLVVTIDAHNHQFFKRLFRLVPGDILHPHQYDLKEYEEMLAVRGIQTEAPRQIKQEFFFDHYLQWGRKQ